MDASCPPLTTAAALLGRRATLDVHSPRADQPVVLPCRMLLHEALEQYDLAAHPYYLVVDDAGMLVGVLAPEEIAARIGCWNDTERKRWADMPVEGLLRTRIEPGHFLDQSGESDQWTAGTPIPCTILGERGKVVAVLTSDDLLISWRAAESTLRAALVDAVTQLPNRLVFHQRLLEEIVRAQRLGHSVGVILIDVDHFKQINDLHGHPAGDLVLQAVARCLQSTMRSYDHVARFGGDEFAVVCCGCRPDEINLPLQRLQQGIRELQKNHSAAFANVSVSIGAAVTHDARSIGEADMLIDAADQCLYRAKGAGRNCAYKREALQGPIEASEILPISRDHGNERPAAGPAGDIRQVQHAAG
ncbi:MAG: GGDEF domain-containing protein [Planctomyces sp.]|nr:GGDEF domain-containing protein [Planctomyces sp.]